MEKQEQWDIVRDVLPAIGFCSGGSWLGKLESAGQVVRKADPGPQVEFLLQWRFRPAPKAFPLIDWDAPR